MIALEVHNISKSFDSGLSAAVSNVSFALERGEIIALLGPSGCGKTTTLRLIAGFERPDEGQVILDDRIMADRTTFVPPEKRGISMVFQDHALFPHLTAKQNVLFGLNKQPKTAAQEKALGMLRLVGLEHLSERYPQELSGGERQRIALARALAPNPVLLLLDEPFSSLDADMRVEVREQVRAILKAARATAVFVTHDQEEALYMGDRIAVFRKGRIEQIDTPQQIFHAPNSRFVAEFIGSTDFIPGEVVEQGIQTELGLLPQFPELPNGTKVEIALRFDDIKFTPQAGSKSLVLERQFRGAYNIYRLRLPTGSLVHAMQPHIAFFKPGTPVQVSFVSDHPLTVFHNGMAVDH
ncbi:MAG TPA: ABC transporter ATP-binding protein [Anaerolineales bacterium]|nr:ABC transporter ATP-binding protein [Anaerolineales bacterium]